MTVSVLPRPTRVGLSKDFLDTDGTIIYAKLVNYLAEDFCRNGQIVGDLMLNSGHYNLILSDRLAHLEYLMAHLPKHLRDQAVMVDGKMTSKKGKAKREQAIEDMRAGKKHYLFATYALAKEGLDIPRLDRLYLTTPQKDYAIVTQSVGRIARLINQVKIKTIHFAFDFMKNEKAIIRGLECFKKHYRGSDRNIRCYVLTNYDTSHEEDWYRVRSLTELGYQPYVMIYQKGTHDRFLTDLARWSNSLFLNRAVSFEDYVPRKDGKSCRELYPEILNKKEIITMPVKTEKTPAPAVDYSGMNICRKLQIARLKFLQAGVKKTGKNIHLEFMYFELADIVPVAEAMTRLWPRTPPRLSLTATVPRSLPTRANSSKSMRRRSKLTQSRRPPSPGPVLALALRVPWITARRSKRPRRTVISPPWPTTPA